MAAIRAAVGWPLRVHGPGLHLVADANGMAASGAKSGELEMRATEMEFELERNAGKNGSGLVLVGPVCVSIFGQQTNWNLINFPN